MKHNVLITIIYTYLYLARLIKYEILQFNLFNFVDKLSVFITINNIVGWYI